MHPTVMFRMRTRCERWRMLSGMRHTRDIRDDSYFKKTPPLGMGGGGELIEKKNKITLIVFNYSVTRVNL